MKAAQMRAAPPVSPGRQAGRAERTKGVAGAAVVHAGHNGAEVRVAGLLHQIAKRHSWRWQLVLCRCALQHKRKDHYKLILPLARVTAIL